MTRISSKQLSGPAGRIIRGEERLSGGSGSLTDNPGLGRIIRRVTKPGPDNEAEVKISRKNEYVIWLCTNHFLPDYP